MPRRRWWALGLALLLLAGSTGSGLAAPAVPAGRAALYGAVLTPDELEEVEGEWSQIAAGAAVGGGYAATIYLIDHAGKSSFSYKKLAKSAMVGAVGGAVAAATGSRHMAGIAGAVASRLLERW